MKTKWLKAFRSLKPASGSASNEKTNQMYHAVSTVLTLRKNGAAAPAERVRVSDGDTHNLQEYTYKKITPCDVCSQVLRGHTRQGLRCRICKMNAHADCASQLPKCQVKQKLLRRQKSTSEIENRVEVDEEREGPSLLSRQLSSRRESYDLEPNEIDQIYQVLKQANEIKTIEKGGNNGGTAALPDINVIKAPECPERSALRRAPPPKVPPSGSSTSHQQRQGLSAPLADISSSDCRIPVPMVANTSNTTPPGTFDTGTRRRLFAGFRPLSGFGRGRLRSAQHRSISLPETAPHSPRRQKLNLRMKSLSLDSPESSELHGQMRRRGGPPGPSGSNYHGGSGGALEHSTPPSNNSRLHSPSSPSQQQRKLLYASRGLRTGSVDLPDDMEKSLSSASTSPCPSPKPHRLLPTNLYVVLYNFKARHQDELDLKAGYKVTVIDTSDPDWWKGKCLGRVGYFPSKYCTRLAAGEKPLQVTHNLQVSDGERGDSGMTLLRDQIVIQVGEEVGGMVMVRSAENRQGVCPMKYLQEV
ncbi:hypothetical protein DMENIID0001_138960 [Sergentomyia squamirostris]